MATKFPYLFVFLLFLVTFEEMIPSEAVVCQSPSKIFRGLCFSSSNCSSICAKEGFIFGACKRFKCVCSKDCKSSRGGGGVGGGEGGAGGIGGGEGGGIGGGEGGEGGIGGGEGGIGGGEGVGEGGGDGENPGQGPPDEGTPE